MRAVLGSLAFIAILFLAHALPYWIVDAMPYWLQAAVVVFLFGVLPVWGFIKVAKWARP